MFVRSLAFKAIQPTHPTVPAYAVLARFVASLFLHRGFGRSPFSVTLSALFQCLLSTQVSHSLFILHARVVTIIIAEARDNFETHAIEIGMPTILRKTMHGRTDLDHTKGGGGARSRSPQ